jgi:Uma2 family endonuclease
MLRTSTGSRFKTVADVLRQLGDVAPERICFEPMPGTATEADLIRINEQNDRLFELVNGVLVEKVMGYLESSLALWIGHLIQSFLDQRDLGVLAGADGAMRLLPELVRIPDLSFISWQRLPLRGEVPDAPIVDLAPDLAVEVLSEGNTPREMERKLKEYFLADVRLVWFVDPQKRTVRVFTSPDESRVLTEGQTLDGGAVLPGLELPLRQVFARLPRAKKGGAKKTPRPRKRKTGG